MNLVLWFGAFLCFGSASYIVNKNDSEEEINPILKDIPKLLMYLWLAWSIFKIFTIAGIRISIVV